MVPLEFDADYNLEELPELISSFRETNCSEESKQLTEVFIEKARKNYPIKDIELAFLLGDCITIFDFLAFGTDSAENGFLKKSRFLAAYFPKDDNYGVSIRNINRLKGNTFIKIRDDLNPEVAMSSVEATILATSLHEVRHRLQKKKMISLFTRKTTTRDERINALIQEQKILFKRLKEFNFKKTRSRRYTSERNKDIEFDATLIEACFLEEVHRTGKFSFEMIQKFLFADPIRLFN